MPPSLPTIMWFEFAGLIHLAWKSPCILVTRPVEKVLPPSSETNIGAPIIHMRWSLFGSTRILL
jgi:hypothetical protein